MYAKTEPSCVRQQSILGPLLFLVYVNNLLSQPAVHLPMKSNTFLKNKDSDLPKLSSWFSTNRLTLNISKSKFISIGNDVTVIDINSSLESTHVGVTINKAMTWGDHVDTISTKINQGLGLLKRILRHLLPLETRTQWVSQVSSI